MVKWDLTEDIKKENKPKNMIVHMFNLFKSMNIMNTYSTGSTDTPGR
jgi:hypothetical protein